MGGPRPSPSQDHSQSQRVEKKRLAEGILVEDEDEAEGRQDEVPLEDRAASFVDEESDHIKESSHLGRIYNEKEANFIT